MKFEVGLVDDFYGVDNTFFKLGCQIFQAIEDESDGYRSCLQEIAKIRKPKLKGLIFFQTPLARVRVEEDSDIDGYSLVDMIDGHVWLRVGTGAYDDYYPYFVFDYHPKKSI
jgi:hypothetical protein